MSLGYKQRSFVEEYLIDFNATQAAIRAGYSEKTARQQGQRLLTKVDIAAEIEARLKEKQASADEALAVLADQERASLSDFYKLTEEWVLRPLPTDDIVGEKEVDVLDEEGQPTGEKRASYLVRRVAIDTYKLLDPRYARLLKSFSDTPKGMKIELHDKQAAADKILRVHGRYKDFGNLPKGTVIHVEIGDDSE